MPANREIDPVQFQIARLSEAMIIARDDDGRQSPGDGPVDRVDGRTRPLSRLRGGPNSMPRRTGRRRGASPERRSISPNPALGKVEGKFSAWQAFEIPRNAEGISNSALLERLAAPERRPIPPNPARGENRGISVAAIAPREADGKRSRREMAPQRLEKIESAPGNGMGSEASNLQDVVHGCAADHPRARNSGVQSRLVSQVGGAGREL